MKKSVVAAVAASNLTVFSGLVNASGPYSPYGDPPPPPGPSCNGVYKEVRNEAGEVVKVECWMVGDSAWGCDDEECFSNGLYPGTWDKHVVSCDNSGNYQRVLCDRPGSGLENWE